MTKLTDKLLARGKKAARGAYERVETRVLVAEGRKAVEGKARMVKKVSRKAARTGLVVGTLTALGVVVREIRKRRKLNRD
jgi:hypothetical protein